MEDIDVTLEEIIKYNMVVEVNDRKEKVVDIEKVNQYYQKLQINTTNSFFVGGSCCYYSLWGGNLEIFLSIEIKNVYILWVRSSTSKNLFCEHNYTST